MNTKPAIAGRSKHVQPHPRIGQRWLRWGLSVAAVTFILLTLVGPAVFSGVGTISASQASLYFTPQQPDTYAHATASPISITYAEDRDVGTYLGLDRSIIITFAVDIYVPSGATEANSLWSVKLPYGTEATRVPTVQFTKRSGIYKWGKWRPAPSGTGGAAFSPIFSSASGATGSIEVFGYQIKVSPPTDYREISTGTWREAWESYWQPAYASEAYPAWQTSQRTPTMVGGTQLGTWARQVATASSGFTPSEPVVRLSVCRTCGILQSYGSLTSSYDGQGDITFNVSDPEPVEWATSWFPWYWLTPVGYAVLLAAVIALFGWMAKSGLPRRRR